MKIINHRILCAAFIMATGLGSAQAQTAPTAEQVCAEARANLLRARLNHLDKPLQDTAHIVRIFSSRERFNEYHVELRNEKEWQNKYAELWMEGYYAMADEKQLGSPLMKHSVGDAIQLHATVSGIDLIDPPQESPLKRPSCRLGVRIDWDRAGK